MKIRYADKEKDKEFFRGFLDEIETRKFLNIQGGGEERCVVNDKWTATFVCEDDKKIIGFGKVSLACDDMKIYIEDLYVCPDSRKKGIGKKLLSCLEKYGKENWPANFFYLFTIENPVMEKLVTANGYEEKGIYKDFIYIAGSYHSQKLFIKKI
jgi:ribosomal protein S18 acetylase RimI-like enzyme